MAALERLSDVFQRSQLTGVSTDEYNDALADAGFGPDQWYEATLALRDAGFDTDRPSESYILEYGPTIADQGYGNMSYSPDFDVIESLTSRGFDPEIADLGQGENNYFQQAENNYLKRTGSKYVPTLSNTTQTGGGMFTGSPSFDVGSSNDNYKSLNFGAAPTSKMNAGSASYESPLIQALRNSSGDQFSNNQGFTQYNYKTPPTGVGLLPNETNQNSAFNPEKLTSEAASAQDVADWNNYNTYRTNALQAKTPYTSFQEWLSGGKVSGIPEPVVQFPVYDFGGGGGG
jgi:hypothetical protein